jgi:hypothetical protein
MICWVYGFDLTEDLTICCGVWLPNEGHFVKIFNFFLARWRRLMIQSLICIVRKYLFSNRLSRDTKITRFFNKIKRNSNQWNEKIFLIVNLGFSNKFCLCEENCVSRFVCGLIKIINQEFIRKISFLSMIQESYGTKMYFFTFPFAFQLILSILSHRQWHESKNK